MAEPSRLGSPIGGIAISKRPAIQKLMATGVELIRQVIGLIG
jgi:hypothetical protein